MEFVVLLAGLGLFVAYPRFWVLMAAIAGFVLCGMYLPRIEIIDAVGSIWWFPGVYGFGAMLALYAGFAGLFARLNRST